MKEQIEIMTYYRFNSIGEAYRKLLEKDIYLKDLSSRGAIIIDKGFNDARAMDINFSEGIIEVQELLKDITEQYGLQVTSNLMWQSYEEPTGLFEYLKLGYLSRIGQLPTDKSTELENIARNPSLLKSKEITLDSNAMINGN